MPRKSNRISQQRISVTIRIHPPLLLTFNGYDMQHVVHLSCLSYVHLINHQSNQCNFSCYHFGQVTFNEKGAGKSGRGVVIQDINASTAICMSRIRDLLKYSKMVPHVKKVEIYEEIKFSNVCTVYVYFSLQEAIFMHNSMHCTSVLIKDHDCMLLKLLITASFKGYYHYSFLF